jgi:hypothetical protein
MNPRPNFLQICIKLAKYGRTFLKYVLYIKALIICRQRLFNQLMDSTFLPLQYFTAELFVKHTLNKGNVRD